MHRFIVMALGAAALASSAVVLAEDPGTAAPAAAAASAAPMVTVAASSPTAPKTQHCWKEYRVGSSFPVTHCEAVDEANDPVQQKRIRDIEDTIRQNHNGIRPPGG